MCPLHNIPFRFFIVQSLKHVFDHTLSDLAFSMERNLRNKIFLFTIQRNETEATKRLPNTVITEIGKQG